MNCNINASMNNLNLKENKMKCQHLANAAFCNKIAFFQYLLASRIRNKNNFIHWGIVLTANYGCGTRNSNSVPITYFSVSTALTAFFERTKYSRENMKSNIQNLFKNKSTFITCIANNQKGNGENIKGAKVLTILLKSQLQC